MFRENRLAREQRVLAGAPGMLKGIKIGAEGGI
jgi:hypothetical protein